jgi:hypothetical protein
MGLSISDMLAAACWRTLVFSIGRGSASFKLLIITDQFGFAIEKTELGPKADSVADNRKLKNRLTAPGAKN